jgi:hypothetical protein
VLRYYDAQVKTANVQNCSDSGVELFSGTESSATASNPDYLDKYQDGHQYHGIEGAPYSLPNELSNIV